MLRANIQSDNDGSLYWSLLSPESYANVESYIPRTKVSTIHTYINTLIVSTIHTYIHAYINIHTNVHTY